VLQVTKDPLEKMVVKVKLGVRAVLEKLVQKVKMDSKEPLVKLGDQEDLVQMPNIVHALVELEDLEEELVKPKAVVQMQHQQPNHSLLPQDPHPQRQKLELSQQPNRSLLPQDPHLQHQKLELSQQLVHNHQLFNRKILLPKVLQIL
jgi:hypothetical protein